MPATIQSLLQTLIANRGQAPYGPPVPDPDPVPADQLFGGPVIRGLKSNERLGRWFSGSRYDTDPSFLSALAAVIPNLAGMIDPGGGGSMATTVGPNAIPLSQPGEYARRVLSEVTKDLSKPAATIPGQALKRAIRNSPDQFGKDTTYMVGEPYRDNIADLLGQDRVDGMIQWLSDMFHGAKPRTPDLPPKRIPSFEEVVGPEIAAKHGGEELSVDPQYIRNVLGETIGDMAKQSGDEVLPNSIKQVMMSKSPEGAAIKSWMDPKMAEYARQEFKKPLGNDPASQEMSEQFENNLVNWLARVFYGLK